MYFYVDITPPFGGITQRHILTFLPDGGVQSWPLTDDNPNKPAYDEWLAAGNTPEEWNPDNIDNGTE